MSAEVKTTTCYMCACRCGIKVWLRDGRVRYIQGNPDHPVNQGVLCAKGSAGIMQHYSPARLDKPIGGGVAESLTPLAEDIRTHARRHAYRGALETTEITIVPTDKRAAMRGGAALVRYETSRRKGETP